MRRLRCAAFGRRCQDKLRQREPKREDLQLQKKKKKIVELFLKTKCHRFILHKSLSSVWNEWQSLSERPRLGALRTEFPSLMTEEGDARTVKNYGEIKAGLTDRDVCSFAVHDTSETLDYLIYPHHFNVALHVVCVTACPFSVN